MGSKSKKKIKEFLRPIWAWGGGKGEEGRSGLESRRCGEGEKGGGRKEKGKYPLVYSCPWPREGWVEKEKKKIDQYVMANF